MRKRYLYFIPVFVLILAVLPWLVFLFSQQSLLPNELIIVPTRFQLTVEASQNGTIEAIRNAPSEISVVRQDTPAIPDESTDLTNAQIQSTPQSSIVIVIETTAEVTNTNQLVGQQTIPPNTTPEVGIPATPSNMIDTEDIITANQLAHQIAFDSEDNSISNIVIVFEADGVKASGIITTNSGNQQNIDIAGNFMIKNYSLIFEVGDVLVSNVDVTEQYQDLIESEINSSIYRLLPGRYVQSFFMMGNEIHVSSKIQR